MRLCCLLLPSAALSLPSEQVLALPLAFIYLLVCLFIYLFISLSFCLRSLTANYCDTVLSIKSESPDQTESYADIQYLAASAAARKMVFGIKLAMIWEDS